MNQFYFFIVLICIIVFLFLFWRRSVRLLKEVKFAKLSLSSKYGKMTEQFMPFLNHFPYDPQNFRFLGTPIDGIQFNDDEIIFIEFKTAQSQLSTKQRAMRQLIDQRRIKFEVIRI